jgi:hypothetical protein
MGQLPLQTLQSCTHNDLLFESLPFGVMRRTERSRSVRFDLVI